jgi:hypothetical protein
MFENELKNRLEKNVLGTVIGYSSYKLTLICKALAQYNLEMKFYVCRPDDSVNYLPKHVAIWALICKKYIE